MTRQVTIGLLVIVGFVSSAQAKQNSVVDEDWSGTFQHLDSRRNSGKEILISKKGDEIRLIGFYDGFTFKRQRDGSFASPSIGTIQVQDVTLNGMSPISIVGFQFCYETGFLVGTVSRVPQEIPLCEFRYNTEASHSIATLERGSARLSGGYRPAFSKVADTLSGAQFIRVQWKSTPMYSLTITKSGYLYALKMYDETRIKSELEWENVGVSVVGEYLHQPVYRTRVKEGQTVNLSGYELSLVAGKIVMP